ncbi:MAG: TlpA disulfide reductase family protein [Flavobacteriaceae bacterium]|nr:TlpA disulfide reductase family protein [Flavobacteriaceae bacterium]
MKKHLHVLLLGLITLILFFLFIKFVVFSISYASLFASLFLFAFGISTRKIQISKLVKLFYLTLPISLLSLLFILEAPNLLFLIPFYFLITYFGLIFEKSKIPISIITIVISLIFSLYLIPKLLFDSLSMEIKKENIDYQLVDLKENKIITKEENLGNILVLSFFNTWCSPCIKEFPDLERLQRKYKSENVKIVLVCAGEMDTKQKVIDFYVKRQLELDLLWYDEDSKFYKENGFSGVPSMLILDKKGNIRHKHSGYNEGMNLDSQLSGIIEKLIKE